jgi:hypothetical protein
MNIVPLFLQIAALVCFIMAFLGVAAPKSRPLNWEACGLLLWLLSLMISGIQLHQTSGVH